MQVSEKGDITTISYQSRTWRQNVRAGALLLLLSSLLLLVWADLGSGLPAAAWIAAAAFYSSSAAVLWYFWGYRKSVEIHPENVFVMALPLFSPTRFPVGKSIVVMLENFPHMQAGFPRESWRVSLGYPEGVFFFAEEESDHQAMRQLAHQLSRRLKAPLADYTYADQAGIVMFFQWDEHDMSFAERAIRFPGLIMLGEVSPGGSVSEEIISSREKIYRWTPFTMELVFRHLLLAVSASLVVLFNIISTHPEALISIPYLKDDWIIYDLIIFWLLAKMAYFSAMKSWMHLCPGEVSLKISLFSWTAAQKALKAGDVTEVRMKPTPRGFALLIITENDCIEIYGHQGWRGDFPILMWLTEKVQDFLLQNRPLYSPRKMVSTAVEGPPPPQTRAKEAEEGEE